MIPRILIIAGSDSGGGAGIQADIKTVTMLGGHAMTAITAITAQNSRGVQAVHPVPCDMVVAQMRSVLDDLGVDAVKIGMIGSAETAQAVADQLEPLSVPIVFDPVMVATSGAVLADPHTVAAFQRLMAMAALVTPNVPELETLAGGHAVDADARAVLAAELAARHGRPVLAKGGDAGEAVITDILVAGGRERRWQAERAATPHTHGTGCTLASAIATGLAAGVGLDAAIDRGIAYVRHAIACAPGFGAGHGPMGHALGRVPFDDAVAAGQNGCA